MSSPAEICDGQGGGAIRQSDEYRAGSTGFAAGWQLEGLDLPVAALGRAVESRRLSHAYLFHGPPGVGKATLARRVAQALVAERHADGSLNLESRSARAVESDQLPDVERIVIGGLCDDDPSERANSASRIRICQIRRLQRLAALAPFRASRRIFIIDAVDDLQLEAAHALLKVLEEPPPRVLLLLVSHDVEAVMTTIRSRCTELALLPMSVGELARALVRRSNLDTAAALDLARDARGRFGAAVRMLEDPSLTVMKETVEGDVRRLAGGGRNERLDYAETLAGRWRRERDSVVLTMDLWASWWRRALLAAARVEESSLSMEIEPADAVVALQVIRRAREHLLANVNPQLALDRMMLDLPVVAAAPIDGDRAIAAPPASDDEVDYE